MLENMEHRGGKGCNPKTGDGAGVLLQIPHEFYEEECASLGFQLPEAGKYGVGMVFFPRDKKVVEECRRILLRNIEELGLPLIGFRVVPADHSVPGPGASEVEPTIEQVFVKPQDESMARDAFR